MTEEQDTFNSWELNGLNSLDLWDYTVELECLQGTEGQLLTQDCERNVALTTRQKNYNVVVAMEIKVERSDWSLSCLPLYTDNYCIFRLKKTVEINYSNKNLD